MLTLAVLQRDFYSLEMKKLTDKLTNAEEVMPVLDDLKSSRDLLDKCFNWVRQDTTMLGVNPDD